LKPARFGSGVRRELAALLEALHPTGRLTIADRAVAKRWGLPLQGPSHLVAARETSKTLDTWRELIDACVARHLDRDAVLVALGGGVVLDLAGFCAATYLRGVRWIAVPTTLLAQVDAAHGGKTGVDHPAAKNLIGAFHPPETVLADFDYLASLPPRELRGGMGEVVKHAVIGDPELLERCGRTDPAGLVERAARVKLEIVARDPKEAGERRILNLGHTLGHALERAGGYSSLHHGEAVAIGLRAACRIAERHCGFRQTAAVLAALDRCGLPGGLKADPAKIRAALAHDKKRWGGALRWALPEALGRVRVFDDVPEELVSAVLMETASA